MADFMGLMKQAAEFKSKMETMQAELERLEVEGSAGGGLVAITLSGKGDLIIVMEHTDSKGRPKLRKQCTYPLTGKGCVSYCVTDLAVLRWDNGKCILDAVALSDL